MIRTVLGRERVDRHLAIQPLGQLLQARLVVAIPRCLRVALQVVELRLDDSARRLVPGVEVDRPQEGFIRGGEDLLLLATSAALLAFAEPEPATQVDAAGLVRQLLGVHEARAHLRQVALARLGKVAHEQVRHRQRQDGVAEELERFVVRPLAGRSMGDRDGQELGADEAVSQPGLERGTCFIGHAAVSATACAPTRPLGATRSCARTRVPMSPSAPSRCARR